MAGEAAAAAAAGSSSGGLTAAQAGLIGSGISGTASVGNTIFGMVSANHENKRQRAFAERMAEKSRQWQIEQWNMENQYNSPAAQMQRFVDAGLNPNLIYGQLGNGLNSAPSVPQADSPQNHVGRGMLDFSMNDYMQGRLIDAQIERLETQNENDSKMTDAQISRFAHLNNLSDVEVKKASEEIELVKARTAESVQALANMKQQWEILDEQKKQERFQTAFVEATQDLRIQGANAEQEAIAKTAVALAMAQVLNVKSSTALNWANIKLGKAHFKLDKAALKLNIARTRMDILESKSRIHLNNAQYTVAKENAKLIAQTILKEKATTESILWNLQSAKQYAQTVYGVQGEGTFWQLVHSFTTGLDACFKMLGQVFSFHN